MKLLAALLLLSLAFTADARSRSEVRKFKRAHPCPFTHQQGCIVDHIRPLCAGGADKIWNMQWQTKRDSYRKDVRERAMCRKGKR